MPPEKCSNIRDKSVIHWMMNWWIMVSPISIHLLRLKLIAFNLHLPHNISLARNVIRMVKQYNKSYCRDILFYSEHTVWVKEIGWLSIPGVYNGILINSLQLIMANIDWNGHVWAHLNSNSLSMKYLKRVSWNLLPTTQCWQKFMWLNVWASIFRSPFVASFLWIAGFHVKLSVETKGGMKSDNMSRVL